MCVWGGGRHYLHDGAHSSAVAFPHASETGLSPNVPELRKERVGRGDPQEQADNRKPFGSPASLPLSPLPRPLHATLWVLPLLLSPSFPLSHPSTFPVFSSLLPGQQGVPSNRMMPLCPPLAGSPLGPPKHRGFSAAPALTLMVTFPLVILRMLKPTVGIMSSLNCPD